MTLRSGVTLAIVVIVGALVATIDVLIGPAAAPPAPAVAEAAPRAGEAVCAFGEAFVDAEVAVIATNVGEDADADVDVRALDDGRNSSVSRARLPSGELFSLATPAPVTARWRDAPVAVHREWILAAGDRPAGVVAGGCPTVLSAQWTVPGMRTSGGGDAQLRVVNPFRADATVAVRFLTPDGPEEPLATQNLSVPAYDSIEIAVNEILPERDDLAAVVEVEAGRVVVEGVQFMRAAIGGIDGASLLAAVPDGAETWHVPWVAVDDDVSSWLWIVNPSEQDAVLEASVHTPDGGAVVSELSHEVVEPGGMVRISLDGVLPAGESVAAVTIRSDGTPIVIGAGTEIDGENVTQTAFHLHAAVSELDHQWVVSLEHRDGREEQLHLVNPGNEHAVVDVAVVTPTGTRTPGDLQEIHVAPGSRTAVDLTSALSNVADGAPVSAIVTSAGGPVIAARVGADVEGPRRFTVVPGIPAQSWARIGAMPIDGMLPGLTQRIGTLGGIRPSTAGALDATTPTSEPRVSRGPAFSGTPRPTPEPSVPPLPGGAAATDDADADDTDATGGEPAAAG